MSSSESCCSPLDKYTDEEKNYCDLFMMWLENPLQELDTDRLESLLQDWQRESKKMIPPKGSSLAFMFFGFVAGIITLNFENYKKGLIQNGEKNLYCSRSKWLAESIEKNSL